jgi:cytochrome P450
MSAAPPEASALHPTAVIGRDYNPFDPTFQSNPYPFYARARNEAPVAYCPQFNLWAVTSHELITQALKSPTLFSSLHNLDNPMGLPAEIEAVLATSGYHPLAPGLFNNDPPGHTRVRALFSKAFTAQRVAGMEAGIRKLTEGLVEKFVQQGHVDLVPALAHPLPMTVIADLLGVPRADMARVKQWHDAWASLYNPQLTLEQQHAAARASVEYQRYYADLLEERAAQPTGDLTTALVQARMEGERPFTPGEMISQMIILLSAGHETTTSLISSLLYNLLRHPEQWQAVKDDPSLIEAAVEETVRFTSPVQMEPRVLKGATELGGVTLPQGARVNILYGAGNHDERAFAAPETFNIHRPQVGRHMGFGWGIHFCIGAPLARLEARVALEVLRERLPHVRLAPGFRPEYEPSFFFRALKKLDLIWDVR